MGDSYNLVSIDMAMPVRRFSDREIEILLELFRNDTISWDMTGDINYWNSDHSEVALMRRISAHVSGIGVGQ